MDKSAVRRRYRGEVEEYATIHYIYKKKMFRGMAGSTNARKKMVTGDSKCIRGTNY